MLHHITTSSSEKRMEILLAMPQDSKIIFPGEYLPGCKVILQNAGTSKHTRETFCQLFDDHKDLMLSTSSDNSYQMVIEMDIEVDLNSPPVASRPYTRPLKSHKWAQREMEDLEKAVIINETLPLMCHP